MTNAVQSPQPPRPPETDPALMATGKRKRLAILVALAGLGLLASIGTGFVLSSRHNEQIDEVVLGASRVNEDIDYGELLTATEWPVSNPDSGGSELYALLSFDSSAGAGPSVWAPGAVTVIGKSIVASYEVRSTGHTSCVVSVIQPDGNRVEVEKGPCGVEPWSVELLAYINS